MHESTSTTFLNDIHVLARGSVSIEDFRFKCFVAQFVIWNRGRPLAMPPELSAGLMTCDVSIKKAIFIIVSAHI